MKTIKDGGPAFPCREYHSREHSLGMSLRDYFAGQALAGLLVSDYYRELAIKHDGWATMGEMAYRQADAMLKAREESDG